MSLAVVIPAHNEERTIAEVILAFHRAAPDASIVVVENASGDATRRIAQETLEQQGIRGRVLVEPRRGKANAVRKAFHEIEADVYVMVDADLTYPAELLPTLLAPVLAGEADMVVGDRISSGSYAAQNTRRFHGFGNVLVRWLINLLFRTGLHDILSGYRVMTRRFVENYPILCQGFELETEMTLHALDKRFRVVEIPTPYAARPEGSVSKLNTVRDGIRVLETILSILKDYRPLVFFGLLSAAMLCLGVAIGAPPVVEFLEYRYVYKVPSAVLATGIVLSSMLLGAVGLVLDTVVKLHRFEFERSLGTRGPEREARPRIEPRR